MSDSTNGTTTIPSLQATDFVDRMADLIPNNWCGQQAKQNGGGGVFNAMLTAIATETASMMQEIQYALDATRIATETDPELSLAAQDFFGPGVLPRPKGDTDAEYAAYITANLFRPAVDRQSIQDALDGILPSPPRLIEPWRMLDVGYVDNGFLDIDSEVVACRVAAPEQRYQGYIEFSGTVAEQLLAQSTLNAIRAWGTRVWLNLLAT